MAISSRVSDALMQWGVLIYVAILVKSLLTVFAALGERDYVRAMIWAMPTAIPLAVVVIRGVRSGRRRDPPGFTEWYQPGLLFLLGALMVFVGNCSRDQYRRSGIVVGGDDQGVAHIIFVVFAFACAFGAVFGMTTLIFHLKRGRVGMLASALLGGCVFVATLYRFLWW